MSGFPLSITSGGIIGSIVFSDLNDDNLVEMIIADDLGNIYAQNLNGESIHGFPVNHLFSFSNSPTTDLF